MRKIVAKPLTRDAFSPYGECFDCVRPDGFAIGALYADRVRIPESGALPLAFSSYVVKKQDQMVIAKAECHDETSEVMLPLDGDVIFHVAPASSAPVPEMTEAFVVPQGTLVRINPGVWHMESHPVQQDTVHILIALPERTYRRDCHIELYAAKDQMEIIMKEED